MADIPGIGQDKPDLKVVREEHPLPGNRKEVLIACENILKRNGVKKLVIELGQPIRVERYVKYDAVGPEQEIVNDDLYLAVRNAEIQDYDPKKNGGLETLFFAFQRITDRGLLPKAFITNDAKVFFAWLGVDPVTSTVFGVDLIEHKDVPDDVLLFVCAKVDEPDVITVTLKLSMEE